MKSMLRGIVVMLSTIMLVLTGCGKVEVAELGKTYQTRFIEYSIDRIDISEVVDGWEGANDFYLLPVDENNGNVGGRYSVEEYKAKNGLSSTDDELALVTITYSAKNISKNDYVLSPSSKVDYDNGYEYKTIKMAYRVSEDGVWKNIDDIKLKKLTDDVKVYREVVEVPKIALEDDKELILYFHNIKVDVRDYITK